MNRTDLPARMTDAIDTMIARDADPDDARLAFIDLLIDPTDSDAIHRIPTIASLYRTFIHPHADADARILADYELCPAHRCDIAICLDDSYAILAADAPLTDDLPCSHAATIILARPESDPH